MRFPKKTFPKTQLKERKRVDNSFKKMDKVTSMGKKKKLNLLIVQG